MSVDGILGDALSHLPLHLSSIPHFYSLSSSAWSALLKLLTPTLYFKEATMLALGHTVSEEGLVVEETGRGLPVTL